MRKFFISATLGAAAFAALAGQAVAAGNSNGSVGDIISDVIMGNEPNIIPFESGTNLGPAEQEPGSLGARGGDKYVIPSGAPGPITCGGGWFGPGQFFGGVSATLPGNPNAPGMNVNCGGNEKPHVP